jgi:predicted metalloprotease with PDZ domain
LERDDVVLSVAGVDVRSPADVERAFRSRRPGETVPVVFERRGERVTAAVALVEDPRQEIAPIEDTGGTLSPAQRSFRQAWLGSAAGRAF